MESNTYSAMVQAIFKPGEDILKELSPSDAQLIHAAMGVSGEAGELLDAIKKATIYRKPIDMENIIEELGDLEYFMDAIRSILGITRDQTLSHNYDKLSKRYPGLTYSNKAAQDRSDKA